ncbi:ROK family protein [Corynebacterium heidelbergense]|uniref:ROK family transcriptional regulator n=1 Tax=Corynebacterium heidelbergense TaxID=2055947 RepID=A0A364VD28_9CORY|nr:helix-turn-helix domain-containing protein [Corynebacterium heidelbergense]RAV34531.1 ROK family transcriptional regulator [Corynebacterium heidelbergense]WCZ35591.1 MarR family protein [Corynebacterium heidelbergense]
MTIAFALPTDPTARCFQLIRAARPDPADAAIAPPTVTRALLQRQLGLSQPSVTRLVTALIEAGLVVQDKHLPPSLPSATTPGSRGGRRTATLIPHNPGLVALGAHIGARSTLLLAVDPTGTVLAQRQVNFDVSSTPAADTLEAIGHSLRSLAPPGTRIAGAGVAFSAAVRPDGTVTSSAYGWEEQPALPLLRSYLHKDVGISGGVQALAGCDLLTCTDPITAAAPPCASTLYCYARELISHAWMMGGTVHRPKTGSSPIVYDTLGRGSLFAGTCPVGAHPLSASSILSAARHRGLSAQSVADLARSTKPAARELLDARARLLAEGLSSALDTLDPHRVVLAGEAFTADPLAATRIRGILEADHPEVTLEIAPRGPVHRAATAVALHRLWQDPLSVARRAEEV